MRKPLDALPTRSPEPTLQVAIAQTADDVRAAQRLRHRVFVDEMGARIPDAGGLDADRFDPHCDHLLVRDVASGAVVGTYRILPPERLPRAGGSYTETEFHLTRLWTLRSRLVEVGRACVHPAYRTGATISLLWSGLLRYLVAGAHEYVIGCASIPLAGGIEPVAALCRDLLREHLAPPDHWVFPRRPLPWVAAADATAAPVPPLLRGYLRLGAQVCGEPAWDRDFGTADLPVLLAMERLSPRYAQRLLRAA